MRDLMNTLMCMKLVYSLKVQSERGRISSFRSFLLHVSGLDMRWWICIASTKAAWKASNKTPQEGLIDYSCACFADEMSKGTGVVKAQRVCKERVREHYGIDDYITFECHHMKYDNLSVVTIDFMLRVSWSLYEKPSEVGCSH
eukprot:g63160.t1